MQMTVIDAEAMLIALAACLVPPLVQLNRHKSEAYVSRPTTLVLLFVMVAGLEAMDIAIILTTQPWKTGATGSATNVSRCCCDALKTQAEHGQTMTVRHMNAAVDLLVLAC